MFPGLKNSRFESTILETNSSCWKRYWRQIVIQLINFIFYLKSFFAISLSKRWNEIFSLFHNFATSIFYLYITKSLFALKGRGNWGKAADGHKASFCLEDTDCDPGFEKKWDCTRGGDQGLSPGCFDIYSHKIDCQWIDYTGIFSGAFFLRIQLNPGNQVAESDFKNNVAKCSVYDYGSFFMAHKCWIGKSVLCSEFKVTKEKRTGVCFRM